MILNHQWWLLIFFLYLLIRIVALKQSKALLFLCICLLVASGRCYVQNRLATSITPNQSMQGRFQVQLNADAWHINGNHAQAVGRLGSHNVLLQLRIKTHRQQQTLKNEVRSQKLTITGELSPIPVPTNRFEFNAHQYYAQKIVFQQLHGTLDSDLPQKSCSLLQQMHQLRAQLGVYFKSLPHPLGSYACRLFLGFNDPQLQSTMKFASILGVIHLFCISGMHVMVLLSMLRYLLVHLHITRETRQWLEIAILPVTMIIGGAGNGLSRAVIMTELQLLAQKLTVHGKSDCWSLGLLIHLLIQPGLLVTTGGQLTYLLSFALHEIPDRRAWQRAVAMNVIALPVILSSFYQVHLLSVLANILIVPLFTYALLPGLVISVIISPLLPGLTVIFNHYLQVFDVFLRWLANMPGLLTFGKLPGWVALVIMVLSLVMFNQHRLRNRLAQLVLAIYALSFIGIHLPLTGEVTFVDIGQGDCAIIRTPFNLQVIMIDTGGQLHFKQAAWARGVTPASRAERTSINYLKSHGISKIDALCLSHHDADHIGFMSDVLKEFKVTMVYVPKGMEKQQRFICRLPRQQPVEGITAGQQLPAHLLTLHPFSTGHADNADSEVLWGQYGRLRFIFMGDLDRNGERKLMKNSPQLAADVIKLGHHGSRTASDPAFLKQLKPSLAIISAGRRNRYGHPHQVTINTLNRLHIPYLSTQRYGMISYVYFGSHGHWRTQLTGGELEWMQTPSKSN